MKPRVLCIALVIALASAYAGSWSTFLTCGSAVSVSYAKVDDKTYTWKFRNDGDRRITYLKFSYSYQDADTNQPKTETDTLPGSLKPGEILGGWAAFTANARSQPAIKILQTDRE